MTVVIALLTACESVAWQRADTDPAVVREDLRACRWEARLSAQQRLTYDPQFLVRGSAAPMGCRGSVTTGGASGRKASCPLGTPFVAAYAGSPVAATQAFLESDYTEACMEAKGYAIAPETGNK